MEWDKLTMLCVIGIHFSMPIFLWKDIDVHILETATVLETASLKYVLWLMINSNIL